MCQHLQTQCDQYSAVWQKPKPPVGKTQGHQGSLGTTSPFQVRSDMCGWQTNSADGPFTRPTYSAKSSTKNFARSEAQTVLCPCVNVCMSISSRTPNSPGPSKFRCRCPPSSLCVWLGQSGAVCQVQTTLQGMTVHAHRPHPVPVCCIGRAGGGAGQTCRGSEQQREAAQIL